MWGICDMSSGDAPDFWVTDACEMEQIRVTRR